MTKPWDLVEDEARRLYSDGMSLKRLQSELSHRHGFKASTRAWRNKIEKWGVKRQRPKEDLARSNSRSYNVEADQQRRGTLITIEHPPGHPTGQDTHQGQVNVDEYTIMLSNRNSRLNESSMSLSSQGSRLEKGSTTFPGEDPLIQGNEMSNELPLGAMAESLSNTDFYDRLVNVWWSERTGNGETRCHAILNSATFTNGEESILHYVIRQSRRIGSSKILGYVIGYMLQHDISLNMSDNNGQTPLEIAIRVDNNHAFFQICDADPSLADADRQDGSLLHVAIRYPNSILCDSRLFEYIKDHDSTDDMGATPLELAARCGNDRIVRRLLKRGARVHDREAVVDLIVYTRLDIELGIDLLERGFLKHQDANEVDSVCQHIVKVSFEILSRYHEDNTHLIRLLSLLRYVCRTYPTLGASKLLDLLQTLVDRGPQSPQGINLLSFVLEKVPHTCMEQKIHLLRTVVKIQTLSPIKYCSKYGHPLDLLARTPAPSRWRYAEILLNEDILFRLLGTKSPLTTLESIASPQTEWISTFGEYTRCSHVLRRCVLHVLTRNALDELSVEMHERVGNILNIRWSFSLPDLHFSMNNVGRLSLIDVDKATTSTNEATESVDSEEISSDSD